MIRAAYLAPEGFSEPLQEAADRRGVALSAWHGALALSPDRPVPIPWAQDVWLDPVLAEEETALAAMRASGLGWAGLTDADAPLARTLPRAANPKLDFPATLPAPSGAFTRLEDGQVLSSARRMSPFVAGRPRFAESRDPPSRAYLKFWEALSLLGAHPGPGDLCYDLGAAPGGWTWVCASLSARVVAFDRAALAPSVAAMLGVRHRAESAFAVDPRREPRIDWLVCDVIAYPARTLALVRRWLESGRAGRIVATVKFQGPTDHETAEAFEEIPGGRLVHLAYNRHELTFLWPAPAGLWPNQGERPA